MNKVKSNKEESRDYYCDPHSRDDITPELLSLLIVAILTQIIVWILGY